MTGSWVSPGGQALTIQGQIGKLLEQRAPKCSSQNICKSVTFPFSLIERSDISSTQNFLRQLFSQQIFVEGKCFLYLPHL